MKDFLVAISEPDARPQRIHEYQITQHSLFAAASMGFPGKLICKRLQVRRSHADFDSPPFR